MVLILLFSALFSSSLTNFPSNISSFYAFFAIPFFPTPLILFFRYLIIFFSKYLTVSNLSSGAFHRSDICGSYGKPAKERGFKRDVAVLLFFKVDEIASRVGIATLCGSAEDANGTLQRPLHKHSLTHCKSRNLIAIHIAVVLEKK